MRCHEVIAAIETSAGVGPHARLIGGVEVNERVRFHDSEADELAE
jgi:hypothetical protein